MRVTFSPGVDAAVVASVQANSLSDGACLSGAGGTIHFSFFLLGGGNFDRFA